MEKYKRVNPKTTDLNLKDVSKIYLFLRILFEDKHLNIQFFESNLYKFTLYQQHFIIKYGKQYFDLSNKDSFISKRIKSLKESIETQEEEDSFKQYEMDIITSNKMLHKKFDVLQNRIDNRIKYYLKHNMRNLLTAPTIESKKKKKIPVYLKTKEFKRSVSNALKDLYSKDQIDDFYNNSFHHTPQTFPPKLLYLEIENSTALYNAMYTLFSKRFKYISENLTALNSKYNRKISRMPKKRQQFYSELKTDKVTRYDFMSVMHNAFPKIRDSYSKAKQKNSSLTL